MNNKIIVKKIITYATKVLAYCEGIKGKNAFVSNLIVVEACVFNLSQIGELTSRLDETFMEKHPDIPWRALYGLRNRIVHDYEGTNMNLIWDIIQEDLPDLIVRLNEI